MQGLLVREPASRLTANQALEHPWIKDQRSAPSKSLNGSVVSLIIFCTAVIHNLIVVSFSIDIDVGPCTNSAMAPADRFVDAMRLHQFIACSFIRSPACSFACSLACLLACLLACMHAPLLACMLACLLTSV